MLIDKDIYTRKIREAETLRTVELAIDKTCQEYGFASYRAYLDSVAKFNGEAAKRSGRPGYHGPARSATDQDLARAAELEATGYSLVKISETLSLSYQACLKWRKRGWKRP